MISYNGGVRQLSLYAVGDRVVVRDDLKCGQRYCMDGSHISDTVVSQMEEFAGETVTIAYAGHKYSIKECGWAWTDGMFAGLEVDLIPTVDDLI